MGIRVCVTGSRRYSDEQHVWWVLGRMQPAIKSIAFGDAEGVDLFAFNWAKSRGLPFQVYAALWNELGRKAGPVRNSLMLKQEDPQVLLAWPGGAGTADCIRKAQGLGVVVLRVER